MALYSLTAQSYMDKRIWKMGRGSSGDGMFPKTTVRSKMLEAYDMHDDKVIYTLHYNDQQSGYRITAFKGKDADFIKLAAGHSARE